jgi:hypothetical protein
MLYLAAVGWKSWETCRREQASTPAIPDEWRRISAASLPWRYRPAGTP